MDSWGNLGTDTAKLAPITARAANHAEIVRSRQRWSHALSVWRVGSLIQRAISAKSAMEKDR